MAAHKLTNKQRAAITHRLRAGERHIDLAREFGVSASGISSLAGRRGVKSNHRGRPAKVAWETKVARLKAAGLITGVIPRCA